MKNYLSTAALAARGTLFKIIGILLVMAAAEIGIFYLSLCRSSQIPLFEELIDQSPVRYIFVAGFVLAVCQLFIFLAKKSSVQTRYTLSRLSISETKVSMTFAVYNLGVIITAWAVQILVIIICSQIYIKANTTDPYSPVLFLAFYRSPFLHGLMPLQDGIAHITNIVFFVGLALTLAASEQNMRRSKSPALMFVLLAVFAVTTNRALGDNNTGLLLFIASAVLGALSLHLIIKVPLDDADEITDSAAPADSEGGENVEEEIR